MYILIIIALLLDLVQVARKAQPSPHPIQVGLKTTQKLYMAGEGISLRSKESER